MLVWPRVSGLSAELSALCSVTLMPCCRRGATSIMMMSSTSITSTSGVTLISDLPPPLAPPRSIDMLNLLNRSKVQRARTPLCRLPDEEVDQLRRGVIHLHVEVLDAAGE